MNQNINIGENIIELTCIDSTNNYLSKLINETDVTNGTVILTYNQTNGRGQRGNSWNSEKNKNIACSYFIKLNKLNIEDVFLISMATANAIHKLITAHFEFVKIKWPNDILIRNKKVCGVLIENSISGKYISQSIVGIGININQTFFDKVFNATSFKIEKQQKINPKLIFDELNYFLNQEINLLNSKNNHKIKEYYKDNLWGFNINKTYDDLNTSNKFNGKIIGVENNGTLLIEKEDEIKKYSFKEIRFHL